ncbi:MAG: hypothetical protein CFE21_17435 [Bacteroidetes bacterium B1(2017)]|nr:MAG: hypothetical protein CFE21_17435 [Bacteroidetes bacterium B1(2017)]
MFLKKVKPRFVLKPILLLCILLVLGNSTKVIAQQKLDLPELIPFKEEGFWGYKNVSGQTIIQAKYEHAPFFTNDKALVDIRLEGITYCGVIFKTGKPLLPVSFELVQNVYSSRNNGAPPHPKLDQKACAYVVMDNTRNSNNKGLLDTYGNEILPPNFETITLLSLQNENNTTLYCFEVTSILNNIVYTALYSNEGKCMSNMVNLEGANFSAQLKPGFFRDNENRIIDSSGTISQVAFLPGLGFSSHPAHEYHILAYDKNSSYKVGIYDLKEKKLLFPIKYKNLKSFGDGFITVYLVNPKTYKEDQLLYNKAFKFIDTLNKGNEIRDYYGNLVVNSCGQVFNKNYQCIFEFKDNKDLRIEYNQGSGSFYAYNYKQHKAMLIDSNGTLKAQCDIPDYGLEKNSDLRSYLTHGIRNEKNIEKCVANFKLLYTPVKKQNEYHRGEVSLDGRTSYFLYEGKVIVEKTELAKDYIFVEHYKENSFFNTFNHTPIASRINLPFKFVIDNTYMFGSNSMAVEVYYRVNKDGSCEPASESELQLINERSNIKNPEPSAYNACEECPPRQKPLGYHKWYYAWHTNSTTNIPLPTLVPQANPSSISFSDNDQVFVNDDTRVVFDTKEFGKNTYLGPTPFYNLFAVYTKKGGLQGYIIKDLSEETKRFTMGYFH